MGENTLFENKDKKKQINKQKKEDTDRHKKNKRMCTNLNNYTDFLSPLSYTTQKNTTRHPVRANKRRNICKGRLRI
jgi:hypothetical protein